MTEEIARIDFSNAPPLQRDETLDIKHCVKQDTKHHVAPVDEPWNRRIKLLLKNIGEKSMGYRWMHEQDANHYEKIDSKFATTGLILSSIITTLTSGSIISLYADTNTYGSNITVGTNIAVLILSLFLSVVIGVQQNNDFRTRYLDHKNMTYKFSQVYHSIQEQFALNLEDRANDKIFLREKIKEYDELMESPLNIRKVTLENYIKATNNNDIYKPAIVGAFEQIDIEDGQVERKGDNNAQYEIDRWIRNF